MEIEITRKQSSIMRGMAILGICTTNFLALHYRDCIELFPKCNEMSFNEDSLAILFSNLQNWEFAALSLFMTWYGVTVFIFLSGYGLTKKYIITDVIVKPKSFLIEHYNKLLLLVLPSLLYFIVVFIVSENWPRLFYSMLSLSFLNELALLPPPSFIYWYFSLAFELYIAFLVLKNLNSKLEIFIVGVLILAIQCLFNSSGVFEYKMLYYIRHNLWGWLPVFMMGILAAKYPFVIGFGISSKIILGILGLSLYVSVVLMNTNFYTWLISPFVAIIAYYILSISIESTIVGKFFSFFGKKSALLFSTHAVVLSVIELFFNQQTFMAKVLIYVLMLTILCPIYRCFIAVGSKYICISMTSQKH